ncbi:hypothetical protein AMAG_09046 [Allomyces macrogynus ATCC 38327]|uniref:RGS domain-containing protein n=1 Tax=Allomyces macrogynus (strain ATCC 38327) TaxID=578462 RepID=A0A0L0SNM7_ALLM3|nr:hypothetical protein AMAG_09046 [Allomyces macrogynus ATCC 38327]|eukprot:KNE63985.1 hypothetical protein AMAG_09046 [Allomyces macrogynus ATCC 38327]
MATALFDIAVAWHLVLAALLVAFVLVAYLGPSELLLRRSPLLVVLQTLGLGWWGYTILQCPDALPWLPSDAAGPLGYGLPRYILSHWAVPTWLTCFFLRSFILLSEYFCNVRMLHEATLATVAPLSPLVLPPPPPSPPPPIPALGRVPMTDLGAARRHPKLVHSLSLHPHSAETVVSHGNSNLSRTSVASGVSGASRASSSDTAWESNLNRMERMFLALQTRLLPAPAGTATSLSRITPVRRYSNPVILWAMLATWAFVALVIVPISLGISGCFATLSPDFPGFPQCLEDPATGDTTWLAYVPMLTLLVVEVLALPFVLVTIRNIHDAYYLRLESDILLAIQFGMVTFYIVGWTPSLATIMPPMWRRSTVLLALIMLWVVITVVVPLFVALVQLARRHAHHKMHATGSVVSIEYTAEAFQRILEDRDQFEAFKRVLASTFCLENGLFWDDLARLDPTPFDTTKPISLYASPPVHPASPSSLPVPYGKSDDQAATALQQRLRRICEMYILPGAPRELNLVSATRERLIRAYHAHSLTVASFAEARREAFNNMYQNGFAKYLQVIKV